MEFSFIFLFVFFSSTASAQPYPDACDQLNQQVSCPNDKPVVLGLYYCDFKDVDIEMLVDYLRSIGKSQFYIDSELQNLKDYRGTWHGAIACNGVNFPERNEFDKTSFRSVDGDLANSGACKNWVVKSRSITNPLLDNCVSDVALSPGKQSRESKSTCKCNDSNCLTQKVKRSPLQPRLFYSGNPSPASYSRPNPTRNQGPFNSLLQRIF